MIMAVNSPSGMCCTLTKLSVLTASSSSPRSACSSGWRVASERQPRVGSTTAAMTSA